MITHATYEEYVKQERQCCITFEAPGRKLKVRQTVVYFCKKKIDVFLLLGNRKSEIEKNVSIKFFKYIFDPEAFIYRNT